MKSYSTIFILIPLVLLKILDLVIRCCWRATLGLNIDPPVVSRAVCVA